MRKTFLLFIVAVSIFFALLAINFLKAETPQNSILKNDPQKDIGVGIITNAQYFEAIEELDKEFAADPRVIELLTSMDPRVSQLYINGHDKYVAAWDNFGFASALVIFQLKDAAIMPIYLSKPGRDIIGVKLMNLGLDTDFIEITSYFGTGGHSAQRTKLLSIKDGEVAEAWDYETISIDAGAQINKSYSSYIIVPFPFEIPSIMLHRVNDFNQNIEETDIIFIWDETTRKFIQKW